MTFVSGLIFPFTTRSEGLLTTMMLPRTSPSTVTLPGNVQEADKSRVANFHEDIEAAPFAKELATKSDPTFKLETDKVRVPAQSLRFPLVRTFQPTVQDPKAKGGKAPTPAPAAAPAKK